LPVRSVTTITADRSGRTKRGLPAIGRLSRIIAVALLMQGWVAVFADALTQRHYWNPLNNRFEHPDRARSLDVPRMTDGHAGIFRSPPSGSTSPCAIPDYVAHLASEDQAHAPLLSLPVTRISVVTPLSAPRFTTRYLRFAPKASPPVSLPVA
jgi:hypothetical protein